MSTRRLPPLPLLLLVLASTDACRRGERVVHTMLPSAAPRVAVGSPVLFRGVEIGTVQRLTLDHAGVRLDLRIERRDAPLRTGDRVALRVLGLLGDGVVDIVPGPATAPPIADGDTLAAALPDTLAAQREAVTEAVVRTVLAPLLQRDSGGGVAGGSQRPAAAPPLLKGSP